MAQRSTPPPPPTPLIENVGIFTTDPQNPNLYVFSNAEIPQRIMMNTVIHIKGEYKYIGSDGNEWKTPENDEFDNIGQKKPIRNYTQLDLATMYRMQLERFTDGTENRSFRFGGKQKSRRRFMKIKGSRKYKSKSKSKSKSK